MKLALAYILLGFFSLSTTRAATADFDSNHASWAKVLGEFVQAKGSQSRVNYEALKRKPKDLEAYLQAVQSVPRETFDQWPPTEKLAFLINAYNAFTVKMVIDAYPIKSFKDIGGVFANPWRKMDQFKLFSDRSGLERIEDEGIRKISEPFDARILFALANSSKGGPRLCPEPFVAAKLDQQLDQAADLYIGDRTRNGYDPKTNTFEVSPLFNWKRADFVKSAGSVSKFLAARMKLEPPLTEIAIEKANVKYLSYDWNLNRQ